MKGVRYCFDTENDAHGLDVVEVAVARRESTCDLIVVKMPACAQRAGQSNNEGVH